MFRDKDEELQRLAQQLLAEEEDGLPEEEAPDALERSIESLLSEEPAGEHPGAYVNYANGYHYSAGNTDTADVDLEQYSQTVLEGPKKEKLTGLLLLMLLLLLGIVGILGYWMLRYMGVLG